MSEIFGDIIQHYHSQLDGIHKVWNYLALFAGGAVTIAWSSQSPSGWLIFILLVGFALFAAGNVRLLYLSQRTLLTTVEIIQELQASQNLGENEKSLFLKLKKTFKASPPCCIVGVHVVLDLIVLIVIAARCLNI